MKSFHRPFRNALDDLAAQLRIAVLRDITAADQLIGPAAVVSPVRAVRFYQPPSGSVARRRRVHLDGPQGRITLLAHLRDGLFEPGPQLEAVQWAGVGPAGGSARRAVAWADPATRSVQLAVRPQTASLADASTGGADPVAVATRYLVRAPLEALLHRDGDPVIGTRLVERTRRFMEQGRIGRARLVRDELALIDHWAVSGRRWRSLPASIRRRADRLRKWLQENGARDHRPTEAQADAEIARLTRLISSRACAGLELLEGGIRGLLNPRFGRRGQRHRALFFRLGVGNGRGELALWDADAVPGRATLAGQGALQCLGDGELVLRAALERADVYGVVDMILNYVESNRVGTSPDSLRDVFF